MKTSTEVERDFYMFLRNSAIGDVIAGEVLRFGERADNATTEDAVIKFLSGEDSLLQTGIVICNIYVPDIPRDDGTMVKNEPRIATLQRAAHAFLDAFPCTDGYQISTDGTPTVVAADDIAQHFINVRFKFYRRAS